MKKNNYFNTYILEWDLVHKDQIGLHVYYIYLNSQTYG